MDTAPSLVGHGLATKGALASIHHACEVLNLDRIISVSVRELSFAARYGKSGIAIPGQPQLAKHRNGLERRRPGELADKPSVHF